MQIKLINSISGSLTLTGSLDVSATVLAVTASVGRVNATVLSGAGALVTGVISSSFASTAATANSATSATTATSSSYASTATTSSYALTALGTGLTGGTLASNILASSLTSIGTLTSLTVNGTITSTTESVGRVNATTVSGSIVQASQPNITTVGTLAGGAVPASLVTAGTFGAGAYLFQSTVGGITTLTATSASLGRLDGTIISGSHFGNGAGITGIVSASFAATASFAQNAATQAIVFSIALGG